MASSIGEEAIDRIQSLKVRGLICRQALSGLTAVDRVKKGRNHTAEERVPEQCSVDVKSGGV